MGNNEKNYYRLFRNICKAINSSLNLAEVLNLIIENLIASLNVKACTVFLWDKKRRVLEVRATHGLSETYLQKGPINADKSISETLKGKSVYIFDTNNDIRVQYPDDAKKEGIASILSVPISVKDQIIGVLRIYTSERRNFSHDDFDFITGLAEIGGIAIDNARMYDLLKTDHESLVNETHRWFDFGAVR